MFTAGDDYFMPSAAPSTSKTSFCIPDRRSGEYLGRYVQSEIEKWRKAATAGGAMPKE